MAIVVYKCDTCKRNIEIPRNPSGLDTMQNCVITHGCRGKLYQIELLPDYQRGAIPEDVSGLENWLQRKVLYNHTQGIERTVWTIQHNLGTFPSIQVLVTRPIEGNELNQEEIQPDDTTIIDTNTVQLTFSRPWAGSAQLIARQSDPNLLNPVATTTETIGESTQISNQGEISIATKIGSVGTDPNINIRLLFATTQGTSPLLSYTMDDQPALNSAWNDFDIVVIKGSIYTVRSFNAITPEITSGVIGNGSTFTFDSIDPQTTQAFRPITDDEVIVLLANTPFTSFDKVVDKYINVNNSSSVSFDFFYDSGEFFAQRSIIQPIYPHIRST